MCDLLSLKSTGALVVVHGTMKHVAPEAISTLVLSERDFRISVSNFELYVGASISDLMLYTVASTFSPTQGVLVARPICRPISLDPSLLLAVTKLSKTSLGVQVVVPITNLSASQAQ